MGLEDDTATPGDGGEGSEPEMETCRVVLWRGYRTSVFYARATGDPSGTSIAEPSFSFRSRSRDAPDTPDARVAHDELVSRLKDDGWVETGNGGVWYETELARPALVPYRDEADTGRREEAASLLEPEPEPEPPPALPSRLPVPPPEVPAVTEAALARLFDVTRPKRRVDRWRLAAAAGLVAAVVLLSWAATHPSAVGTAPSPPHLAFKATSGGGPESSEALRV
jgi:hypothetical protein